MNIFFRLNLIPNSLNEFKNLIKNYNKFPFILSVESLDKEVQIHAARDSRVDVLSFSDQEILKTLSSGVISLTKQNNSLIEFSLEPIMIKTKSIQSKNFRNLYKFMHLALKLKANYIISGNFTRVFDLRHPRSLVSICNSILEMPLSKVKEGFKDNPMLLIKKVQKRGDESSVGSGVKLIIEED
jgi:RNase P/RNase MRP subunit p30